MNEIIILLVVGVFAGFLSGLVGIGGGIVIIPALIYFLGYSQQMAQGTTLFLLLLPTGAFAVWNYYQAGYIDWKASLIVACTFLVGGFLGSKIAITIDQNMVKKIFACFMILMGIKMFIWK